MKPVLGGLGGRRARRRSINPGPGWHLRGGLRSFRLDRVLAVVVNQAATIIPFDRCAIALVTKGKYEIDAIAGESEVNEKDPKVKKLNEMMDWAGQSGAEVYVSAQNGKIDSPRASTSVISVAVASIVVREEPAGSPTAQSVPPPLRT